ncbi:hypothetical protein [Halovulum sp. GXIMD14793]
MRKLALTFAALLVLTGMGAAIFAHAFYTADGDISPRALTAGLVAAVSLVIGPMLAIRVTRDKPVDISGEMPSSLENAKLGIGLIGLGLIALLLVTPLVYSIIEDEAASPGTSAILSDFPIKSLQPALHWLHVKLGAIGPALPFAILGQILILGGWASLRSRRKAQKR